MNQGDLGVSGPAEPTRGHSFRAEQVWIRGGERVREEEVDRGRTRPESYEQQSPGKSEVLQEIPEQAPRAALSRRPEISGFPKLLPKDCGDAAIARQDECRRSIGNPRDDANRHDDLDEKSNNNQGRRDAGGIHGLAGLSDRPAMVENFVKGAERQENQDQ
jgi:hypothetical protein